MTVKESHFVVCPAHNRKVELIVYFKKEKASPKDIGFVYDYRSHSCDFTRNGERCTYIDCPLVEELHLKRSIYQ